MRAQCTYVGLALVASCMVAGPAQADNSHLRPKNRRALDAYREAISFMDRTPPDYDSGIKLLRKALTYERAAGILRNLAIAYAAIDDFENAVRYLEEYAKHPALTADERAQANAGVERLRKRLPPKAVNEQPPPANSAPDAPRPTDPTPIDDHRAPSRLKDKAALVIISAGAVATLVGVGFRLQASSQRDQALRETSQSEIDRLVNSARSNRRIGLGLILAGIATAAVGGVKLYRRPAPRQHRRSVSVGFSSHGIFVSGVF